MAATRLEMVDSAAAISEEVELGDWLILGDARGVEKAPVDWRWRVSKRSCSSFGRRGGEGPVWKGGSGDWVGGDERKWWGGLLERRRCGWRLRVKRERLGDLDGEVKSWKRRGVSRDGMVGFCGLVEKQRRMVK